jgi:hypothetical protein
MNKRIKQLMGQTLDEKFSGTWSVMDMQDLTKFADRFAELIVRECIAELESVKVNEYRTDVYDIGYDDGLTQAVETIKEHFGVDE